MSKERLEELKKMRLLYEVCFVDDYASAIDDVTADFDLLIEQAELMQRFAKKNAELNIFLSKYSESKHLGKNVIDVAMDIIEKQTERVQELEDIIYQDERQAVLEVMYEQKERYKEAIKEIQNEAKWMLKLSENGEKFRSIYYRCEEALEEI